MSTLPRLVCATANPGKVAEIAALLDGLVELLPRPADVPDVIEDADTLSGNARLKAAAVCAGDGIGGGQRRHGPVRRTRWAVGRAFTRPGSPASLRTTQPTGSRCWPRSTVMTTAAPTSQPSP